LSCLSINDITLSLDKGSFLGFVGPNGGGKTTLLRTILWAYKADFRGDTYLWTIAVRSRPAGTIVLTATVIFLTALFFKRKR